MRLPEARCGGPAADLRRMSHLMRHKTRCGCPVAGRRGGWRLPIPGEEAPCRGRKNSFMPGGALRRVGRWSPFPGPGKDFRAVVRKNIAVPEPESRLQVVVGESAGYPLRMAVRFLFRNLLSVSGCGFREGTVPRPVPCRAVNEERLIALDVPGPFPCRVPDCRSKAWRDSIYELNKGSRS